MFSSSLTKPTPYLAITVIKYYLIEVSGKRGKKTGCLFIKSKLFLAEESMKQVFHIEKLVHGGYGLSRTDRGVVFVSGVAPGETVRGTIRRKIGGVPMADCEEVIEASLSRRHAACPYFGECGGCDWLHIAYHEQVKIKQEIFRDCLGRIGRIADMPDISVIPSPEFGYRMRCRFTIDRSRGTAGFLKKKTNDVVSISYCPLLCDSLNGLLSQLASHGDRLPDRTHQIKAIAGTGYPSHRQDAGRDCVASFPVIKDLTSPSTLIRSESYEFCANGDSFFQANRFLSGKLGLSARDWLCGTRCVDCYGGTGFFSVFSAPKFTRGILVDRKESDVACAKDNFRRNGVSHFSAVAATVLKFLTHPGMKKNTFDCCIVDPPRPGLDSGIRQALAAFRPRSLFYVSCNPATQARDAGYLVRQCGYKITKAALFDLYPQTHHMETVLLFTLDFPKTPSQNPSVHEDR